MRQAGLCADVHVHSLLIPAVVWWEINANFATWVNQDGCGQLDREPPQLFTKLMQSCWPGHSRALFHPGCAVSYYMRGSDLPLYARCVSDRAGTTRWIWAGAILLGDCPVAKDACCAQSEGGRHAS